jgi:hypothetical protein
MSTISAHPFTRRVLVGICAAAALAFGADAGRAASRVHHTSVIGFSGPVAVPGHVLAAGEYVFEIANADTSHDVVRVRSRSSGRPVYAGFAREVRRPQRATRTPAITFHEAPAGAAAPIRAWYPDGLARGFELIYR